MVSGFTLLFVVFKWQHASEGINPFTAAACNISGLNDARIALEVDVIGPEKYTVYFSGPITSTSNAMRFDENPFT